MSDVTERKPKRGRPRAYDPDAAMDRIVDVFWKQGFAATSLDDLGAAAGMNRPSLYAAFGDKKAIYRGAVQRFRARMRAAQRRILDGEPDIRVALREFLLAALKTYGGGEAEPRGCMALCTANVEAATDADIRADLSEIVREIDLGLTQRLRRAKNDGQLPEGADPAALARLTAAVMHSLAIRTRAGQPTAQLARMVDDALAIILPD